MRCKNKQVNFNLIFVYPLMLIQSMFYLCFYCAYGNGMNDTDFEYCGSSNENITFFSDCYKEFIVDFSKDPNELVTEIIQRTKYSDTEEYFKIDEHYVSYLSDIFNERILKPKHKEELHAFLSKRISDQIEGYGDLLHHTKDICEYVDESEFEIFEITQRMFNAQENLKNERTLFNEIENMKYNYSELNSYAKYYNAFLTMKKWFEKQLECRQCRDLKTFIRRFNYCKTNKCCNEKLLKYFCILENYQNNFKDDHFREFRQKVRIFREFIQKVRIFKKHKKNVDNTVKDILEMIE